MCRVDFGTVCTVCVYGVVSMCSRSMSLQKLRIYISSEMQTVQEITQPSVNLSGCLGQVHKLYSFQIWEPWHPDTHFYVWEKYYNYIMLQKIYLGTGKVHLKYFLYCII